MAPIRSFVAIVFPDDIKAEIHSWVKPLRQHDTSVRWVHSENLHLTLKFLGSVEEDRFENEFYPEFPELLSRFQPIKICLKGIGQFPPQGRPRVLWAGLAEGAELLVKLAGEIDAFFEKFGFISEKRPFRSHLTLARIKQKPSSGFMKVWKGLPAPSFGECIADRVTFYRSELTKEGAVYRVLREFPLGTKTGKNSFKNDQ